MKSFEWPSIDGHANDGNESILYKFITLLTVGIVRKLYLLNGYMQKEEEKNRNYMNSSRNYLIKQQKR